MTGRARVRRAPARPRPRDRAAEAPGHPILDLQRSAGNHAVAELARKAEAAPQSGSDITVEIEGVGTIRAATFAMLDDKNVVVTGGTSELTPKLTNLMTRGTPLPKVVISAGAMTMTLSDVFIANMQTGKGGEGSAFESITFNFAKREVHFLTPDAVSGA